jgi:hypothetical protein
MHLGRHCVSITAECRGALRAFPLPYLCPVSKFQKKFRELHSTQQSLPLLAPLGLRLRLYPAYKYLRYGAPGTFILAETYRQLAHVW